ncbi:MAG: anaerobic nitric oxide reductase flavorubredoxin [Bacillota bacterium]
MAFKVNDNITWVGKIDWELRKFHGEELSAHRGSSYNSYLVRGKDKIVLIDTVWRPFAEEFVTKLKREINLKEIDYIIANHGEVDHSGSLPELLREIPGTPVYCSGAGVKSLRGQYHQDWNFQPVKTGDKIDLGGKELIFIEAKMLHWPDSMFCYLTEDNILFPNDAFGQHYASELMYNDLVDQCELFEEAIKYYANILTPFSKLVSAKIKEVVGLGLPVDMICPSHGVIWREDPLQIVNKYLEWADSYQENQVTVIYDTMWDGTRKAAEAIAAGIKETNDTINIKLYNAARSDINDVITEIFKSKGIVVGSPTVNKGILHSITALMDLAKGLNFQLKKGAAFGCYGWSGESVKLVSEMLEDAGFELINKKGLRMLWSPGDEEIASAVDYGKEIGAALK